MTHCLSQLDWDKLRIFHVVAESSSLTKAATRLNVSQSSISRQITALEDHLGISLFHRHARGLLLTEQGSQLFATVHEVFGKIALVESSIRDTKDTPFGDFRITTTVGFGSFWLTPRLKKFNDRYPGINLQLILDDKELDLSMREADFAIRMWRPEQAGLIQRPFLPIRCHLCASQEYIDRNGLPIKSEDLSSQHLIVYSEDSPILLRRLNWLLMEKTGGENRKKPVLEINNLHGILLAVEAGLGIASLPDYLTKNNPRLVRVLSDLASPVFETYMVYPEELRKSKRVAVFRDFLLEESSDWEG